MRPQDAAALGIKTFGNDIALGNALNPDAGTLNAIGNQRRVAVVDTDNRRAAAGNKPFLDVGIVLHRAMPVEMIGSEVEKNAGSRIDRGCQVNLVGRALNNVEALRLRRIEAQYRRTDIAAKLRIATSRFQNMCDQRRGGRLAVGPGNRNEGAIRRVGTTFSDKELDIADDLDAGGFRQIDGPVRLRMRQRHARCQHEGGETRPVNRPKIRRLDALGLGLCDTVGIIIESHDVGTAGDQRPGRDKTRTAEPEKNDFLTLERRDRDHRSPQLQGSEAKQREANGNDPETDDHLAFRPALFLEMVMDRRHQEDAPAGALEPEDLDDDRQGFHDEETADDDHDDLVLGGDCDGADQATQRERTRIAHEDGGGRRIKPQKTEAGTDDGADNNGEFTRAGHEIDLQVIGKTALPAR